MIVLQDILKNIAVIKLIGDTSIKINKIAFDSRQIIKGDLFVAVKGTSLDGHEYINQAIDNKAVAIVCEQIPEKQRSNVVYIQVDNSSKDLAILASNYYCNPSDKLTLVGVTGTNGKTTTATLLYRMFRQSGYKAGLFSTVVNLINDEIFEATHTTPDPIQLHALLKKMVDNGCEYAFMEVSSHSLVQDRVAGLNFKIGIFSNITHDHLDYHKSFDEYIRAKKIFFDSLSPNAFALYNNDDRNGKIMVQNTKAIKKSYALKTMADFKAKIIESHLNGMLLLADNTEVWTKFIGQFNAYNLLAVYSAAILLGLKKENVLKIISQFDSVDGRFEYYQSAGGKTAIVDYAHTPDALLNVLTTINEIRSDKQKIITVIGAGGNRDKTKRPEMARVTIVHSDKVIFTSDNPRFEDPDEIIKDMIAGVNEINKEKYISIADRKEAIKTACAIAGDEDIILIAGKGHETYQDIKGVKHHFNDKEIIAELFQLKKLTR